VVEATLKLTDPPPPTNVMLLALPSFDALMQVFDAFRARLQLQAFEFFTDRALHHVLAHGAQAPFAETHPYYVVTEFASDEGAKPKPSLRSSSAWRPGWSAMA
jgi:FAD/FMN-containing dehydrogenase